MTPVDETAAPQLRRCAHVGAGDGVSQLAQFFAVDRDWSGYYFAVLLLSDPELDGVAVTLSEAQDAATVIFGPAREEQLRRLDPDAHGEEELRRFFEEFTEYEDPDAGRAMRDALTALRRHLSGLDDSSLLLLTIG